MSAPTWWQDAVCYQIYPRSFADANGDGIGDLPGIIARLDYLRWLGVDAIWLSPFYPSPQLDWGYDVSDYQAVDPDYGTLADVERLIAEAHRRGIRVLLDLVLNHTSDQHPWFRASRSSRADPQRDWYIWRDGVEGGPPNDWESLFGGSAWAYDAASGQYYYHFFFAGQPDLNWRNPAVREAIAETMRFWLDRGVDGFRLDAISHLLEREDLPNAEVPESIEAIFFAMRLNLFAGGWAIIDRKLRFQQHLPENHAALSELRALVDSYGDRVLLGETFDPAYYGDGRNELHSVFNFTLVREALDARALGEALAARQLRLPPGAWECTTVGNHDRTRAATYFADGRDDEARMRVALALVAFLRGTPVFYNGEEIGMRDLPPATPAQLKDGLALWAYDALRRRPDVDEARAFAVAARAIGRDACRTPMQWADAPNAGFAPAGVATWLPVNPDYAAGVSVAAQRDRPASTLSFFRALLAARRASTALRRGDLAFVALDDAVLAFWRRAPGEACLVVANLSAEPVTCALPGRPGDLIFASAGVVLAAGAGLTLPPYGIWVGAFAA